MKKNIAMRVAAFLFILTMISTCAFATTFAKYTTSGSANDEARVAKWGVNVNVTVPTDGMFQNSYAGLDSAHGNTVVAESTSTKVIAPGTSVANAIKVEIKGTPEVDVKIEYKATVTLTGWENGSYMNGGASVATTCPLVITVGTTPYKVGDAGIADAAALAAKIKEVIETKSVANINANTSLDSTHDLTVSWAWAFEGNDANDTALGNLAAEGTAPTIYIKVECIVTQID